MRQSQNMSWEFFLGLGMNQLLMRVTSLAAGGYNQMTLIREQHLNIGYDFLSSRTQKASSGEIRPRVAFPQWAAGSEGAEEARQPLTDLGPTVHTLCTLCTRNSARTVHTLCVHTLHFALPNVDYTLCTTHCLHTAHCDAEANSYPAIFHRSPITPCFFGLVRTALCQTASFRITLLLQSVWKRMFSQSSLAVSTWPCSNAESAMNGTRRPGRRTRLTIVTS